MSSFFPRARQPIRAGADARDAVAAGRIRKLSDSLYEVIERQPE